MILLPGGTSETAPLAEALARAGYDVLVSTATDIGLFIGNHPRIEHRHGGLDAAAMAALIQQREVQAVVDAAHPYAERLHETARRAASAMGVPYFRYVRPECTELPPDAVKAADHAEAARLACRAGKPILLTVGSRHIRPYAEEATRAGIALFARILDHPTSHQACRDAGMPPERVLTGRGPFSVEENRRLIAWHGIGVLVTKESGDAGGLPEKLEAARCEGAEVIVVERPCEMEANAFSEMPALLAALEAAVPPPKRCQALLLDLESVLVPEIWEAVAQRARVPELALTTRDIPDYEQLMARRIEVCRQRGLGLTQLLEIVATLEPLDGAREFLAWARERTEVMIVSDTFHELAGPLLAKLASPPVWCHTLRIDPEGYLCGFTPRDEAGKPGAVAAFQHRGRRVAAVGDSFNDLGMLRAADVAFLFRPSPRLAEPPFPSFTRYSDLKNALTTVL
ncbi:MAG: bifunctional phosphoserine phosphatase/homoserine phosphotransferase ThrH [Chthoniobacteraceae bacterium]